MSIHPAVRRQTIQARFTDGRVFEGPIGTTIEAFIKVAQPDTAVPIVAALKNGKLRELSNPLTEDADLIPVTTEHSDGSRIYRRSLSFLLIVAAAELFPERVISIEHSMPFGGYYCETDLHQQLSDEELQALKTHMASLVAADLPITQVQVPLEEALEIFRKSGDSEKGELFLKRRKGYLTLYELKGIKDYFHGFMVPRTSYLNLFDLHHYSDGFMLHFPRRQAPNVLQPFVDEPRLARVFQEYKHWLTVMGVPSVCAVNKAVTSNRLREIILVAEALHEKQIINIASQIVERPQPVRLVLISGPTSAGKTTFSKRLAIQLMAQGRIPITIGMDNYFVERDKTPRDDNGDYDFEALEALDVALFQHHLKQLLAGELILQPRYNFHTGMREWGEELGITPNHVLIIEGIHGLNPQLVAGIPAEEMYRIFIAAFTQLNLDKHNRVPTTDTRLLRRIVRDAAYRGYTAADTIGRWQSVRRGEKRHIFPHQENADVFFNSALSYELSALKRLAYPLLLQVEPGTPERVEANRLMAFLQWFEPIPEKDLGYIASNSILREFIGGSILDDYEPWL